MHNVWAVSQLSTGVCESIAIKATREIAGGRHQFGAVAARRRWATGRRRGLNQAGEAGGPLDVWAGTLSEQQASGGLWGGATQNTSIKGSGFQIMAENGDGIRSFGPQTGGANRRRNSSIVLASGRCKRRGPSLRRLGKKTNLSRL